MAASPRSSHSAEQHEIEVPTPEERRAIFDELARSTLGISGPEFVERWNAGEWRDDHRSAVIELVIMLPFAR